MANRQNLYAHFDLTDAQARLADLLHDAYSSASDGAASSEGFNDFFDDEAQARMGHVMLYIALRGADARIPAFPGDQPPKTRTHRKGRRDSIFERVKAAVTVEELAGRFTELKSAGVGKLKALCPIHHEKTPSFRVDKERQTWNCYGACAMGGDVIALAQELMNRGKL